jgi:cell division protease FtsH
MMGVERKSAIISDNDRKVTAVHEAGHALVAKLLPQGEDVDPVHKVTIIPRGAALGLTQQIPAEDRLNVAREWAEAKICIAMGGRIAEELKLNRMTAGAAQDIEVASQIARRMVCEWGMSEALGPLSYGRKDDNVFLGRDYTMQHYRNYSEDTAIRIDSEIRRIVQDQYHRAEQLLKANLDLLDDIAKALLAYEVLDAKEINVLVAHEDLASFRQHQEEENKKKRQARTPKVGYTTTLPQGPDEQNNVLKPATVSADS